MAKRGRPKGTIPPNAGKGRPKGVPNKTTTNAKEALIALIESNVPRMQLWLDEIAEEQGAKAAWECVRDILEFHFPKKARTEVVGENDGPLRVLAEVAFVRRTEDKA